MGIGEACSIGAALSWAGGVIVYKRLDAGAFRIPEPVVTGDAARLINERAFEDLLAGIDLAPVSRRHRVH